MGSWNVPVKKVKKLATARAPTRIEELHSSGRHARKASFRVYVARGRRRKRVAECCCFPQPGTMKRQERRRRRLTIFIRDYPIDYMVDGFQ